MLNVGNLKVKSDHILYIVPQSLELGENGNARIKVIHYTDSPQADMVYSTFDEILEKLPKVASVHQIAPPNPHSKEDNEKPLNA